MSQPVPRSSLALETINQLIYISRCESPSALYRLLGDEARLRLLRVLDKDRFTVKELTGILGLAQSGVSRHLGLLKEAGLVAEERDGAYSFYRLSPALRDHTQGPLWP